MGGVSGDSVSALISESCDVWGRKQGILKIVDLYINV